MQVEPWSPGCGGLVKNVQLATIGNEELSALKIALGEHGVLFFRDQELPPADHLAFARRFGKIVVNKYFAPLKDFPEIAEVRKEPDQTMNIGGGWHTDHSYETRPALGSILVARDVPAKGGNTQFANLHNAWKALPQETKDKIAWLRAVHSSKHIYGKGGYYADTDQNRWLKGENNVGDAVHPVVIAHPENGREVLYVNPSLTVGIVGWSAADSEALLNALYDHAVQDAFTCQFNWLPGSVAIWDNRMSWHNAQNDYDGQRRLMHRITLAGEALQPAISAG